MSRIHESHDGSVYVSAISNKNGAAVNGHVYYLTSGPVHQELNFQLGPVLEAGFNGTTTESVLAVVLHRLRVMNAAVPCRENALAITKLEEAVMWLEARTKNREQRGVEGTNQP